jgi:hypothetical protein
MKVTNINLSSSLRIPVALLHVWILTESYSGRNRRWTQKSFSDLKLFVVFCIIKWFIIKSAIINKRYCVEIKCQLDATDVFIADLIACSTCFGHHYADHQELESIIQLVAACGLWCLAFKLSGSRPQIGYITLSSTPYR